MAETHAVIRANTTEVLRALREVEDKAPRKLRLVLNSVVDTIVPKIKSRVPRRTGTAAASVRAQSTSTKARLAVGGGRATYFPWLDFGGRVGRRKSVSRPFIKTGRYVYPTLAAEQKNLMDALDDAFAKVARESNIETTGRAVR